MFFLLVVQYLTDLGDSGVDRSVDDFVLISMHVPHFAGRGFQASINLLFALGAACSQPFLQFIHPAGMDEQRNRVEFFGLKNRQSPLDVDLQNNPPPLAKTSGNLLSQRPVPASEPENLLAFQEFSRLLTTREFLVGHEKVVFAVDLALSRITGGGRNAQVQREFTLIEQSAHDRRLSRATGPGNDDQSAWNSVVHAPPFLGTWLLEILNKFPHSFNRTFYFNDMGRDFGIGGLAANRIGFSKHLLDDEIQFSTGRLGLVDVFARQGQRKTFSGDCPTE